MSVRIRLYTHEVIVHSQIAAIEKSLNRAVNCEINLNSKKVRSTIEFDAEEKEISALKHELGYNVMVFDGNTWLPHM